MSSFNFDPGVGGSVQLAELTVPSVAGDMLIGNGSANPVLLNIGATGNILAVSGGTAVWQNTLTLTETGNVVNISVASSGRTTANGIDFAETGNAITSAKLLSIAETGSAVTAARTGSQASITSDRTTTGATVSDNFDNLLIQRNSTETSGTLTVTGSLLKLENIVDANTTDSSKCLEIVQDAQSTGNCIDITHSSDASTGSAIKLNLSVGANGIFITHSGNTANGLLRMEATGNDISNATLLFLEETTFAPTLNRTGQQVKFQTDRSTDATSISDDFDNLLIERLSLKDGAGTFNILGSVLKLRNQITAVDSDATHLLELDQDTGSSGTFINFAGTVGVGNPIEAVGAKTLTVTHFLKVNVTGGLTRYIEVGTIA